MSRRSLRQHLDDFLSDRRHRLNRSPHTVAAYERDVKSVLDSIESAMDSEVTAEEWTTPVLRGCLHELAARGLKPATIGRKRAALSEFSKYLVRHHVIEQNPVAPIPSPKHTPGLPVVYAADDLRRVLEKPRSDSYTDVRDHALLEILYGSGLRISELLEMRRELLDVRRGMLRVTGKGRKDRFVFLSPSATRALNDYLKALKVFVDQHPEALENGFWLSNRGKPLSRNRAFQIVRKHLLLLGGEKASPHVLRHCFATHLLDNDANLREVQELLGHTSLATTEKYTHVSSRRLKEVYHRAHPHAESTA